MLIHPVCLGSINNLTFRRLHPFNLLMVTTETLLKSNTAKICNSYEQIPTEAGIRLRRF